MVSRVLGARALSAVADREEERAVGPRDDPGAEVLPGARLVRHRENDLHILQSGRAAVADQLCARNCRACAAATRLREAEEDQVGTREIRRGGDVEQSALTDLGDLWDTRNRLLKAGPARASVCAPHVR